MIQCRRPTPLRRAARALLALATFAGTASAQQTGSVRGRVVEEDGNQPVPSAQIIVVGTRVGTLSRASGEYQLTGVPAGQVSIRVQRLGYQPTTQSVTVPANGEVVLNVSLNRAVTRLSEVVTTATGDVEKKTFGNTVATIKADSVIATAPITSVNELLQARTAGVQIIQGTGQTGSSSSIRIRGTSSLSLTNEPLIIVDGIRFDNGASSSNFSSTRVNRFSTFNPDEIESIDVIKGPSAAALYGTAAANGVIVIRTKRGQAGRLRITTYGEYGQVDQRADWDTNYWSWGRNLNAQGQPVAGAIQCRTFFASARRCVVDSLNALNPWVQPETDPFAPQPRFTAGLQLSGGSDVLRYFISGETESETGPYTMPVFERNRITQERGSAPRDLEINPNQLTMNSLRGNFQLSLRPNLTLDFSSGYIRRNLYNAFEGTFFAGMTFQFLTGPGYRNATYGLQREFLGDIFGVTNQLRDDRYTGSVSLNWQPYSWLTARAVTGLDQTNSFGFRQQLRGEGPRVGVSWGPTSQEGGKDYDRSNATRYSVDLGATAIWDPMPEITTRTSIGAQRFFDATYQGQGRGYGLPPGASTPNSARQRESWEFTTEEATYGAFIEEQIGWRNKLYLTGALRTDQTSAFGRNAGNTTYPRAALSYLISDEDWFPRLPGVNRMRLRTAYGKAGVQPTTIAALQFLGAAAYPTGASADEPGLRLASIGNAQLKPEVTTEFEAGIDAGLFNERINVELTMFRKKSRDALFLRPLPPSFGTSIGSAAPTQWENLAAVQNNGFELAIDAILAQYQAFSWNVRLNGSTLDNELKDAGNVPLPTTPGARNEVGYPLFGLWDRRILGFADRNSDGILTDDEIDVTPGIEYKGSTLPLREAGFTNTFGFFNNTLQVNALFDYRGKFYKYWQYEQWRCVSSSNCRAVNDPSAALEDQAAAVAANSSAKRTIWGYFVPNDFIKFRELSATWKVPSDLASRYLRASDMTLTVAGRNLGYPWDKYPGIDPESNNTVANTGGGNSELTAQPPLRYLITRVNIRF